MQALDTLLNSPYLAGLLALPNLANLAADARNELLAAEDALTDAEARALAASSSTPQSGAASQSLTLSAKWTASAPSAIPHFNLPAPMRALMLSALSAQIPALLCGAAGTGKTESVQVVAHELRRPMLIVACAAVRDPSEWFGSPTMHDGRIAWQDSALVAALSTPHAIVLLDEVNRSSIAAQNGILSLLDGQRGIEFPARAGRIAIHPTVSFAATINEGIEYSGTQALDAALASRFTRIETDYMTAKEEAEIVRLRFPSITAAEAKHLAAIAEMTRSQSWTAQEFASISTRAVLLCARLIASMRANNCDDVLLAIRSSFVLAMPSDGMGGASARTQLAAYIAARGIAVSL